FNTATGGGGGIDNFGYNGNASPVITNCIFYGNTATDRAGAMYCWGGGNGNASPTILNSVFVNNSSVDGGGIVSDRTNFVSGNSGTANPTVRNSIFWGNSASGTGPQFYILGGAGFTATFSAIDISNQNVPHTITGPGTGNIFIAPAFVNIANAAGTDNCWLTNDDGLHLQVGSTGIDAGDNAGVPVFDIRNYNRIINGVVDLGPYEFNSTVLPVSLTSFLGHSNGMSNILFWSVTSENNNRLFEIGRSTDGISFEKIGEVNAEGNSSSVKQYQFVDDRLIGKQYYYYRLKQIDVDGKFSLSNTILLTNPGKKQNVLVFPNPVVNSATVLFQKKLLLGEEFLLLNNYGKLIDRMIFKGTSGTINLTGKVSGLYFLVSQKLGVIISITKIK
ncbi:choice-of-anchor Q domain-containing protein, partial [Ferruginibacter sp.]